MGTTNRLQITRAQMIEHQAWTALVFEMRKAGVGEIGFGQKHERLHDAICAWGEELAQLRMIDDPEHATSALEERRRKYLGDDEYEDKRL